MEVENSDSKMESDLNFKSTLGKFLYKCLAPTETLDVIMSVCLSIYLRAWLSKCSQAPIERAFLFIPA